MVLSVCHDVQMKHEMLDKINGMEEAAWEDHEEVQPYI